jgi:CoA:oxalate CoA-transferase
LTTAECQAEFDAAGVPSSPYRTVKEVLADPQLAHRGALAEVRDKGGRFQVLNPPFRLSAAPVHVARFAASLGEQTREILELAGYAAEEIEKMSAEGIVGLSQ